MSSGSRRPVLIPQWRRAWRFFSVQAMALSAAVHGTWAALPGDMRASIPAEWVSAITVALMVLGVFGRLVLQEPANEDR